MQAIKQRYGFPDTVQLAWRPIGPYCVQGAVVVIPAPVIDPTPQPPVANCRVHFSGLLMSDRTVTSNPEVFYTKIYEEDIYSEFVGAGEYPDNEVAFPKSIDWTFDGIAVDSNTRLVIYSGKNFTGSILLDITGPALLYNNRWQGTNGYQVDYGNEKLKNFTEPLQSTYPQSVRYWSNSNMNLWNLGSTKIICGI